MLKPRPKEHPPDISNDCVHVSDRLVVDCTREPDGRTSNQPRVVYRHFENDGRDFRLPSVLARFTIGAFCPGYMYLHLIIIIIIILLLLLYVQIHLTYTVR